MPGIQGELSTVTASLRDLKSEWDRDPRIRETLIALEKDVKQVLPLSVRAEFQEEVDALRSEIDALQRQVDDLEGRNDQLLSENAEYLDRIASLERDAEAVAELDALLAATRDQLSASIDEEEAAAGRVQELDTQVSALRAAQELLRIAIGNIAQDLDGIISDYEAEIVGVPERDRLIYVNRFDEVLDSLRELAGNN